MTDNHSEIQVTTVVLSDGEGIVEHTEATRWPEGMPTVAAAIGSVLHTALTPAIWEGVGLADQDEELKDLLDQIDSLSKYKKSKSNRLWRHYLKRRNRIMVAPLEAACKNISFLSIESEEL